ncbi:hypothetical protein [Halanaerobaculum tunisiense]
MLTKLILAAVIAVLFYLYRIVDFKLQVLLHPILLTPLLGSYFGWGGFTTGIILGALVELLWGSNLVDYLGGLKYGLLVSLLTVVLMYLTQNISLYFNLSLVLILVFSLQQSLGFLEEEKYFVGLVFLFNLVVLSSAPLIKLILGWIPAQFIDSLQISGGLFPLAGLAIFVVQGLDPTLRRDNVWYYAYGLATLVTIVFVFNKYYFGLIFFPLVWYTVYYLWHSIRKVEFKDYLKWAVAILAFILAPEIVEISSPLVTGSVGYILLVDILLTAIVGLQFMELTALESYFIILLLGVIGSQFSIMG